MRRAYRPRQSTLDLRRRIAALDGVDQVRILAPHHGVTVTPARLRVYLEERHGERAYTDFSMAEARAWIAAEEAQR